MDAAAILALVEKGLTIAAALLAAGQAAEPAIEAILKLVRGQQSGTVTDADLTQTEALLDQMIADFNVAM